MADEVIVNRKYRIVRQIGVGGMGAVYEVEHVRLRHVRYALKQLKRELEREKDLADRFDKEAMRMSELQHPNIVRVYDIDVDPDFGAFILMDLIQGANLSKIIREQGRRPLVEVVRIGSEIASALDFAHSKGIVHRDIKPGNIIIEDGSGRAVLTDFGIAKKIQKEGDETDGTRTGVFVGTYRYASPEQMRNEEPDPRWDIYSFGIVLYEAVSGNRFLDKMAEGQIFAHVAYMPDWKPTLDFPEAPPEPLARVINECLERDRERRIVSASELMRRLQACLEAVPVAAPPRRPAPAPAAGPAPGVGPAPAVEPAPVERPPIAAEALSAVTAIERYDTRRAELRARAEERLGVVERLERAAEAMGLAGDWPSVDDVRASLAAITELEDSSQYEEAMRRLEAVGERGTEVRQSMEQFIRRTLVTGIGELRARWEELGERARPFVPAAEAGEIGRALATGEERVEAEDWTAGWENLTQGRRVVDRAEAVALQQARAKIDVALDGIRTQVEELQRLGADVPADLEPRSAGEALETLLEAGRLTEADGQSAALLARARQATEAARQKSEERVQSLGNRMRELHALLEVDEAGAVAPEEMEGARRAEAEAADAERRGDRKAATDRLELAVKGYEAAAAAVDAALERRAGELQQAVRALLERSASAPAPLVEAAMAEARQSLQLRGGDRRASIGALERARDGIESALAEAPLYAEAEERRREVDAARDAAASAGVAVREQRDVQRLTAGAEAELKERRWAPARDLYTQVRDAWTALEAEAKQRDAAARLGERRGRVQARLRSLGDLEKAAQAFGLAAGQHAGLDEQLRELGEVSGEQAEGALARLAALEERIADTQVDAEKAFRQGLTKDVTALAALWQETSERAGRFVGDTVRKDVSQRVAALGDIAAKGDVQAIIGIHGSLSDCRRRIDEVQASAAAEARTAIAGVQKEIEAAHRALAGRIDLAAGLDPAAVEKNAAALLGQGRLTDAFGAAEESLRQMREAAGQVERADAERLAEARRLFDAEIAGVDAAALREAAATEVERAERARATARRAEKGGDARGAAAAYEEARAAHAEARRIWSERQKEHAERLAESLRATIANAEAAPEVVVGEALGAARRTIEASAKAEPAAAIAELTRAGEALEASLADVAVYRAAEQARVEAEQAAERVAALPLSDRERKAALKTMENAGADLRARRWPKARDRYAEALQAWGELEAKGREIAAAAAEEVRRTAAAREALQKLVAEIGAVPAELAGPALSRAREMIGAAAASLPDLEQAQTALEALRAEMPRLRAAVEQRETAKAMEQRVLAMRATRKQAKEPRRLMAEADSAFGKRQWAPAGEGFAAAYRAWADLAEKLHRGDVTIDEKPRQLPTRQIAVAAGALFAVGAGVVAVTMWRGGGGEAPVRESRPPAAERPEKKPQAPSEKDVASVEQQAKPRPVEQPVKPAEQPKPPEVEPLVLASADPAGESISMKEAARQAFSVTPRGGAPGAKPVATWYLDGALVASDANVWEYAPGFDAAGSSPHRIEARVGSGADEAKRSWSVDVEDVNRAVEVASARPLAAEPIKKKIGEKVELSVDAKDADGDTLRYQWTIDGKRAGSNAPSLALDVDKDHEVAVEVGDGKAGAPAKVSWEIAAIAPEVVALAFDASPKALAKLAFNKPATFKLSPKRGAPAGIAYEWRVDGEKVADGPSFEFRNQDRALVRKKPVQIAALAKADGFEPFTYAWKIEVVPPAPEITRATPATGKVAAEAGATQSFELTAGTPVGEQELTYVFTANGKKTESSSPTFRLAAPTSEDVTVVASVRDNFGQRSAEKRWTVLASVPRPPVAAPAPPAVSAPAVPPAASGGVESPVKSWLDQYREAFNRKDVDTLGSLLRLDAGKRKALADALSKKQDLRITLSNVQTSDLGDGTARVSYSQLEQFTDASTGRNVSLPTKMTRTFRVRGGVAELQSTQAD